jgi:hypothetical protein
MEVSVRLDTSAVLPSGIAPPYQLDRMLDGPQSLSGRCGKEKNLAPTGNESLGRSPSLYRLSYRDPKFLPMFPNSLIVKFESKVCFCFLQYSSFDILLRPSAISHVEGCFPAFRQTLPFVFFASELKGEGKLCECVSRLAGREVDCYPIAGDRVIEAALLPPTARSMQSLPKPPKGTDPENGSYSVCRNTINSFIF